MDLLDMALVPLRIAIDMALPPRCPGCGAVTGADHVFCLDCWQKMAFLTGPACAACGVPFEIDPGADARCGACLAEPPEIDGMRAAVAYGEIARTLALKLKYGRRPGTATTLARQMRRLVLDIPDPLLIPVPLHRWRLWRRGYNQSLLIAKALTRETGIATQPDIIQRSKATPILRGMGSRERRKTVRGAFRIMPDRRAEVAGRNIILVDDVYTTGATVNACARVLKRAGAASVRVCCWARVVRDIDNGAME